jgi:ribosomal protein S27E
MGDKIWLQIKCGGCGELNPPIEKYNEDPMDYAVLYAPSSGFMDFKCYKCGKTNWIESGYHGRVVDDKELKELYKREGFA